MTPTTDFGVAPYGGPFLLSYIPNMATHPEVKRIGDTGQVSVGKALAGRLVRLEPAPDGVTLRFVVDVPVKDAW